LVLVVLVDQGLELDTVLTAQLVVQQLLQDLVQVQLRSMAGALVLAVV
jgi:hypothetical protein